MSQLAQFLLERFPENNVAPKHFGDLLEAYRDSGLAPPHLIPEVTSGEDGKLWSYVWEAMLFRHLSSLSLEFVRGQVTKAGQRGPDFGLVLNSQIVWVEATAPAPEDIPEGWLAPPMPGKPVSREMPTDQMLLRWTAAIGNKVKCFENYLAQGIVAPSDYNVIAVNSCRLSDFVLDDHGASQLPFAVEAVFPVGPLGIPLTSDGQIDGKARPIPRFSIKTSKGIDIPTDSFLNPAYSKISAVLGSNKRHMLDGDLRAVMVHNPLANNRLPIATLGKCR